MTRTSGTKARLRIPLTRDRALDAAVAIADAEGIDALTMRRLAAELGVEAMSLYHHVANKNDILDGMVDLVFGEIDLSPHETDWMSAMVQRATSLRAALLRHRWAITIMESRSSPGPATLRHHEAVIGRCRRAGFSVEMSARAFSLMDSYIYGFAMQEANLPFDDSDDLDEVLGGMMPDRWAEDFPNLAEMTSGYILRPGYSYGNEFEYGLRLILTGLRAALVGLSAPGDSRPSERRGFRLKGSDHRVVTMTMAMTVSHDAGGNGLSCRSLATGAT